MDLWQWVSLWVWLAGLGTVGTAPSRKKSKTLAPEADSPPLLDRANFFDYPDLDQTSLLAVAQITGEKPVNFVRTDSSPGLFHHVLLAILVVAFLFLLFQFCTHM
ncbi:fertilization-influencing membrane protein [Thomomys bottae]